MDLHVQRAGIRLGTTASVAGLWPARLVYGQPVDVWPARTRAHVVSGQTSRRTTGQRHRDGKGEYGEVHVRLTSVGEASRGLSATAEFLVVLQTY